MAKKAAKKPAKRPPYRLKDISDEQMSALQRALRDAIYSGPRGIRKRLTGPFQICAVAQIAVSDSRGDSVVL